MRISFVQKTNRTAAALTTRKMKTGGGIAGFIFVREFIFSPIGNWIGTERIGHQGFGHKVDGNGKFQFDGHGRMEKMPAKAPAGQQRQK